MIILIYTLFIYMLVIPKYKLFILDIKFMRNLRANNHGRSYLYLVYDRVIVSCNVAMYLTTIIGFLIVLNIS